MQIDDVFPKIPQVKRLLVTRLDENGQDPDFNVWVHSFQGLINRQEPHSYLIRTGGDSRMGGMYEDHWLEYYKDRFDMPTEECDDIDELIERYKDLVSGYVMYDNEDVIQTQNLATVQCGLEGVLPIAPNQEDWMIRHGIPKRDDLRGRFADDWDAAEWAIDNLWPHTYKRIYANFCIHRPIWYANCHDLQDFIVMHKGMALDLPRTRPMKRSLDLYHKMMSTSEGPGVQMNWHCAWEQEKEYVGTAAQYGYFALCSITSPNLSIHGGIGDLNKSYEQPLPPREECKAEKGKVYVCFYNSDGDATWAMNNLHSGNWHAPERGSFEFGWGFLPIMVRLQPAMLQYYHETKTDKDCFWGPSSGAGYTYSGAWPDNLVDDYLSETRRLLTQTGQNGCNMVNWFLQDYWREVVDEDVVNRERKVLGTEAPGLVCGLGGSPYATNYIPSADELKEGLVPKLHSMQIANVGRDNVGDLIKFAEDCPTRPTFCFLFAQISPGIWAQLESELEKFESHPELEILSMDRFFLTLQDAINRGMVGKELYEKTDALQETWLRTTGRNRLPLTSRMCGELVDIFESPTEERRRAIADAAWTQLVSGEIETAANREHFLNYFKDRKPCSDAEEDDTMYYVAFTVMWHMARNALEAKGIYSNHRRQTLDDFRRTCGDIVDTTPFEKFFASWEVWDEMGSPPLSTTIEWMKGVAEAGTTLSEKLGPEEGESFTNWPPRSI
jgi:hypothetical protein